MRYGVRRYGTALYGGAQRIFVYTPNLKWVSRTRVEASGIFEYTPNLMWINRTETTNFRVRAYTIDLKWINRIRAEVEKVQALIFHYEGELGPGQEIIIDMDRKTVTIDGQNAVRELSDDSRFFDLLPGDNIIEYEDEATGRSVLLVSRHRDRFV